MRRIVIVCLLLFVPLQWSWAMASGVGSHECGCGTVHVDAGACGHAAPDSRDGDCAGDAAGVGCGSSCADCHGQFLIGLLGGAAAPMAWPGNARAGDHAHRFRNHIPDHPLRPPLATLV